MSHAQPDVCLLVEGTYPFVSGGVSSWVDDIIRGSPDKSFHIVNVGAHPGAYGAPRYALPDNVTGMSTLFCHPCAPGSTTTDASPAVADRIRALRHGGLRHGEGARFLKALRALHVGTPLDCGWSANLFGADIDLAQLLHGDAAFALTRGLARELAPDAAFVDFFWHLRGIHVPLLRLLQAPTPVARCYHAVSTGYAGLLAAAFSHRTGRPFMLTEHGIYARERQLELARADWVRDRATFSSPLLEQLWTRFFLRLSEISYHHAHHILTLSDANRYKQVADGAPPERIQVVPNGVDTSSMPPSQVHHPDALRVGFVGRVVPIKDLVTFIRGCDLALRRARLDVQIIGPDDEDASYARRCKDLVEALGRSETIRFLGTRSPRDIYPNLDVVVLTSFSEGQPLVILEAYAAGVPVVTTDVGSCREMVEGGCDQDRMLGPSGFVVRVADAQGLADALQRLAVDPALRERMGNAGRARVTTFYQRKDMLERYQSMYARMSG